MRKQGGFTLIEVMVALIVGTLVLFVGADATSHYLDAKEDSFNGEQLAVIGKASEAYVMDNYDAIVAVAGPAVPAKITTLMLVNAGYLPGGYTRTNTFGQSYILLITEPEPNDLQALLLTQGGKEMPDIRARRAAQEVGARGGVISVQSPDKAVGARGGWQIPLADYDVPGEVGHLAEGLFFADGSLKTDYLYRFKVPGRPELNRMNTDIDMDNHNLNNAGKVNASDWFRSSGETGWVNETYDGGWYMNDPTWIRAYNDKSIYTGGTIKGQNIESTGRAKIGEYVQLQKNVAANGACAPNGLLGRLGNGTAASCINGHWAALGGGISGVKTFSISLSCSQYGCYGNGALTMGNYTVCALTGTIVTANGGTSPSKPFCSVSKSGNSWSLRYLPGGYMESGSQYQAQCSAVCFN